MIDVHLDKLSTFNNGQRAVTLQSHPSESFIDLVLELSQKSFCTSSGKLEAGTHNPKIDEDNLEFEDFEDSVMDAHIHDEFAKFSLQ